MDQDFPVVFRALVPLDSIAQRAGRCNRNRLTETGRVYVFLPENDEYRDAACGQAARVTRILIQKFNTTKLGVDDPELFDEHYSELYDLARPENKKQDLMKALQRQDVCVMSHVTLTGRDQCAGAVPEGVL